MQHRVTHLLKFLASEFTDTEEGVNNLLTESNLKNASEMDDYESVDSLKQEIYSVYVDFGFEMAKGVFEVTVVESFNLQQ